MRMMIIAMLHWVFLFVNIAYQQEIVGLVIAFRHLILLHASFGSYCPVTHHLIRERERKQDISNI